MAVQQTTSISGTVGRLVWMLFGPMILTLLIVAIAAKGTNFSLLDVAYWSALAATVAGRWLEFKGGNPQTAEGEPANIQNLRRYSLAMTLVGLGAWGAATVYRML
jgi:hypothetical protein